jgi:hypothetical protein
MLAGDITQIKKNQLLTFKHTIMNQEEQKNSVLEQANTGVQEEEVTYLATAMATAGISTSDAVVSFLYNPDTSYSLGEAINLKDPRYTIQNRVLKFDTAKEELSEQHLELHLVSNVEQLRTSMNMETKFSAKLGIKIGAENTVDASFLLDERNLTFVLTGYKLTRREEANISNFEELRAKYESDPYLFHDLHGTHYVESIIYGHYIYLAITFKNIHRKFKLEMLAAANGGGNLGFAEGEASAKLHSYLKRNKVASNVNIKARAVGYNLPLDGLETIASDNLKEDKRDDKYLTRVKNKIGEYLGKITEETPQKLRYSLLSFNNALLNNSNFIKWSYQHDYRMMQLKREFRKCLLYKDVLTEMRYDVNHPYRTEIDPEAIGKIDELLIQIIKQLDYLEDDHARLMENRNLNFDSPIPIFQSEITDKIDLIKTLPSLSLSALIDSIPIDDEKTNILLSKSDAGVNILKAARQLYGESVETVKIFINVQGYQLSSITFPNHPSMRPPLPEKTTAFVDKKPFEVQYKCKSDIRFEFDRLQDKDCLVVNKFRNNFSLPMLSFFYNMGNIN